MDFVTELILKAKDEKIEKLLDALRYCLEESDYNDDTEGRKELGLRLVHIWAKANNILHDKAFVQTESKAESKTDWIETYKDIKNDN